MPKFISLVSVLKLYFLNYFFTSKTSKKFFFPLQSTTMEPESRLRVRERTADSTCRLLRLRWVRPTRTTSCTRSTRSTCSSSSWGATCSSNSTPASRTCSGPPGTGPAAAAATAATAAARSAPTATAATADSSPWIPRHIRDTEPLSITLMVSRMLSLPT